MSSDLSERTVVHVTRPTAYVRSGAFIILSVLTSRHGRRAVEGYRRETRSKRIYVSVRVLTRNRLDALHWRAG